MKYIKTPVAGSIHYNDLTNHTIYEGASFPALYATPPADKSDIFWGTPEKENPNDFGQFEVSGSTDNLISYII
tara:strand:+ start:673 stop:891 length:219 start_codon:yes stop_codon:yes gene_type:complete